MYTNQQDNLEKRMGFNAFQEGRGMYASVPRKARGKRISSFLLGLAALGVVLASCSSSSSSAASAPSKAPAKLQSFSLGFFTSGASGVEVELMQKEGIFAKYGLDPNIVSATSGPSIVAGELSGTINIGIGYMGLILPAIIQGHDLKFVAPYARPNFYNVIAQKSISVKPAGIGLTANAKANIRAMKGATVGVAAVGGLNDLFMAALATASGLSPTGFTQVAAGGPPTLVTAFKTDRIQYLVTDHPVFTLLKGLHVPYNVVAMVNTSNSNDWKGMVADDWVASPSYIDSHKSLVMDFCRAMVAGRNYMGNPKNRAQVLDAAQTVEGITPAESTMWYKHNVFLYSPGIAMTKSVWTAQKEWLAGTPYAKDAMPSYSTVNYSPCTSLAS